MVSNLMLIIALKLVCLGKDGKREEQGEEDVHELAGLIGSSKRERRRCMHDNRFRVRLFTFFFL